MKPFIKNRKDIIQHYKEVSGFVRMSVDDNFRLRMEIKDKGRTRTETMTLKYDKARLKEYK